MLLDGLEVPGTAALEAPVDIDGEALNGLPPVLDDNGVALIGPEVLDGSDDDGLVVPGTAVPEDGGAVDAGLTLGPDNEGVLLIELEALVLDGAT